MNLQLALSDGRGGLGSQSKTLQEAGEQSRTYTAANKPQASPAPDLLYSPGKIT